MFRRLSSRLCICQFGPPILISSGVVYSALFPKLLIYAPANCMRYREFYPQHPLSRFVECFWTLEAEATSDPGQPERILPDGCTELILNFGAKFSQHEGANRSIQPKHFLVGQMTGPILISPTGAVELIGIRFHPGGTFPFFRVPM